MKRAGIQKVKDLGPYLVDEKLMGNILPETNAMVMDNVWDRDKHKPRVKLMYTSNVNLLAGSNTVAVFRKKIEDAEEKSTKDAVNATQLFVNYFNKKSAAAPTATP